MKRLCSLFAAVALASCSAPVALDFHVIPMPAEVSLSDGVFRVRGASVHFEDDLDEASMGAVLRFVSAIEDATGKQCRWGDGGFVFQTNPELGPEEYTIDIKKKGVLVEASALNGFVYACETMKQMMPSAIYGGASRADKASWVLPCGTIHDSPRFAYRGMHLDPCRHFWSIEETKRYLDVMTAYKINRFHWHLTEDQGWRMEIKRYPRLTEVGAWRSGTMIKKNWGSCDGIPYGGFYTVEEMKEIVAYAAARGITVIPEIDLPGHMQAALAAYPSLGCTGGPYEVWTQWGVSRDILCAGNEEVFEFLEGVLTEVMDIFPSEYIHIGGDECFTDKNDPWDSCPKCAARMKSLGIKKGPDAKHYLQNYVTARVQKFLGEHGRKVIGWDEILQGKLEPGATVMSWRGTRGGIEAAAKGFDAIMTPYQYLYFDYYQSKEPEKEPFCVGSYLPVEKVYGYEPLDGITPGAEHHIIGVQGNLWTEYVDSEDYLEYMLLPRMCALSEIQWCRVKDYDRFFSSLDHTFDILDAMGLNYCAASIGLIGLHAKDERHNTAGSN